MAKGRRAAIQFLDADEVVATGTGGGTDTITANQTAVDVGSDETVLIQLDVTGDDAGASVPSSFVISPTIGSSSSGSSTLDALLALFITRLSSKP